MELKSVSGVVKGARIAYTGDMANCSGIGAVVAIREHKPIGQMYGIDWKAGKMVPIDSSKSLDVVLEDGRSMSGVFASNIGDAGGCRFKLLEGVASDEEIAGLIAGAALKVASDKSAAEAKTAAFEVAKAAALAAGKALGLVPESEFNESGKRGSAAASNLRAELKAAGIKKARVKQDGYSAILVYVAAADIAAAKAIADKYEAGHFNSMEDIYEYSPGAWGSVFGDVQYVSVYRGDK